MIIYGIKYTSMFQEIPMNKADFITALKNETDLTKSEAESVVPRRGYRGQ